MTTCHFSPSRLAFYPDSLRDVYEASPQGWPDDGVEVSPELYERLYSEHLQGRVFCAGPDGEPMTKEPDPPSPEQVAATERAWRGSQLDATDALVQHQLARFYVLGPSILLAGVPAWWVLGAYMQWMSRIREIGVVAWVKEVLALLPWGRTRGEGGAWT